MLHRIVSVSSPGLQQAMAGLLHDLLHGMRRLGETPGHTLAAVLTIALGVGGTTLLFSVVDGVLLKPLPWPESERLVRVTETRQGRTGRITGTVSNGSFLAWRENRLTIEDIGGWLTQTPTLTGAGEVVRVSIVPVTPGLFPILRAYPLLGRLFEEPDGEAGSEGVIILSYGLWQERFAGSEDVLGRIVRLDDRPHTIVGVMPPEFAFPDREAVGWTAWSVPAVTRPDGSLAGVIFRAIARLRDGATPAQASAEATARSRSGPDMGLAAAGLFGAAGPIEMTVVPETEALTAEIRPALLLLLAAVSILLVTATASVAMLQLVRATARRREMAVRIALGAGQGRIVRLLLLENLLVGFGGLAGAVGFVSIFHELLPVLLPLGFPRLEAVLLDVRAFSFALAIAVAAGGACSLLPAWHARRLNLVETLAEDGTAPVGGVLRSRTARVRGVIMTGQVAIACVLLVCASLLTRSFLLLAWADRGYDPVNVLTARLPFPGGDPVEHRLQVLDRVVERIRSMPDVTHVAYANALPLLTSGGYTAFRTRSPLNQEVEIDVQAAQRIVVPDYFGAMRLRLVAGRFLSDADTPMSPAAVVVNRTFARQYLGEAPVGLRIHRPTTAAGVRLANDAAGWNVVGVVDDMRQEGVDGPLQPEVFLSVLQVSPSFLRTFQPIVVVRTSRDPAHVVPTLRSLVQEQAPSLVLESVMTMEERLRASLWQPRLYAVVLGTFGSVAMLIAAVGLSGVLAFTVAQRTREIGVRAALGAEPWAIVALVVRQVAWIVGAGIAVGLVAASVAVHSLSSLLYGVSPYDGLTFAVVPVVIAAAALMACVVPARRAAAMDPLSALRFG